MHDLDHVRAVRYSVSIYLWLLALYPSAFRNRYWREMELAFRELAGNAWKRRGPVGLVELWGRTLPDTLLSAGRERVEAGNLSLFWRRALALFADRGITFAFSFWLLPLVNFLSFGWLEGVHLNLWTWPGETSILLVLPCMFVYGVPSVVWAAIIAAWSVYRIAARGQTPGMDACGLRLVDASGHPPGWRRVLLWHLASYVSGAAFGLGYAWALVDSDGRTWHDIMAGVRMRALPLELALRRAD